MYYCDNWIHSFNCNCKSDVTNINWVVYNCCDVAYNIELATLQWLNVNGPLFVHDIVSFQTVWSCVLTSFSEIDWYCLALIQYYFFGVCLLDFTWGIHSILLDATYLNTIYFNMFTFPTINITRTAIFQNYTSKSKQFNFGKISLLIWSVLFEQLNSMKLR